MAFLLHQTGTFPLNLDEEFALLSTALTPPGLLPPSNKICGGQLAACGMTAHWQAQGPRGRPARSVQGAAWQAGTQLGARSLAPRPLSPDRVGPLGSIPSFPHPPVSRAPLLAGPEQHCPALTRPVWDRLGTAAPEHLPCDPAHWQQHFGLHACCMAGSMVLFLIGEDFLRTVIKY